MKLVPLALGGLVVTLVILFLAVYILRAWWSIPLFGFGAGGEDQPIAFSHVIHVQENDIACEFCHRNVPKGQAATVPAVEQCLFCHKTIADSANPELAKLMGYVELGPQGEVVSLQPIDWEKVHRLPDTCSSSTRPRPLLYPGRWGLSGHGQRRGGGVLRRWPGADGDPAPGGYLLYLPWENTGHGEGEAGSRPENGGLRRLP